LTTENLNDFHRRQNVVPLLASSGVRLLRKVLRSPRRQPFAALRRGFRRFVLAINLEPCSPTSRYCGRLAVECLAPDPLEQSERVLLIEERPLTENQPSSLSSRGGQHRIDAEVVRDLERQFREAHRDDPELWGQRFVDGSYLVRGSGLGRFHLLAAAAARAIGCAGEQEWIEMLIRYLFTHNQDREFLKVQPAALYVNPKKTLRKPSSLRRQRSWLQVGATIGPNFTRWVSA